ncbi:MAG TPA: hypothetical protein VGQ39_21725 [Pyrinomonadaceae bacterium]|jgi:hypothetical protein|nr:hypothetical protein [Pyrinomonadaceae bacterium]
MTRNRIGTLLIGALALIAIPVVSEAAPPAAKQWSVDQTNQINNETEYALYNGGRKLGYDNRTFGVDLGWVNGGFFFFVLKRPDGQRNRRIGLIAENDNVAIFNTKRNGYLKYYQRGDAKAELEWSDRTPAYEWQIQDQSASGGRVHFALFNSRVKKYLVYQFKNYGINLGWLSQGPPTPLSFSVAMSQQPITNGWVPYLGTFGKNLQGNLLSVQNASQKATLMFVKPGQSTNNCSDTNATLRVAPGGNMTVDQMKTLYGSTTPRLPINFLACITTPTLQQSIGRTYLNITYKLDP